MKSLLRIERVAVIRWSTLAFVAVLLFPLFFLRYGNTGAVVQSAMVMALPVTAARSRLLQCKGALLVPFLQHPRPAPASLQREVAVARRRDQRLPDFAVRACRRIRRQRDAFVAYHSDACVHRRRPFPGMLRSATLGQSSRRLERRRFFIVAGLTVSSGMFEDAPMLYAVIPTTWVLNGVKFAGYVIPVASSSPR